MLRSLVAAVLGGISLSQLLGAQSAPTRAAFPLAAAARTERVVFHATRPAQGTLEAQVTASLDALTRANAGARFVKLRVFARGAPALDSARAFIARRFTASGVALPAISLVGVVGFPDTTQLVAIESTAESQRLENPNGVAFVGGLASPAGDRTVAGLGRVIQGTGVPFGNVLRVTCLYESADQVAPARASIASKFPNAEMSFVQSYVPDAPTVPAIECEAVGRLASPPRQSIEYFNPAGSTPSPFYSRAALVSTPSLIFASAGTAVDTSVNALRAAFDGVKGAVEALGGRLSDVVMGDNYWRTAAARDRGRDTRAQYFGETVPAATGIFVAGLSPAGAVLSIELTIAVRGTAIPGAGASGDTITLSPGAAEVDGRYLTSHLVEVTQTVTKGGSLIESQHYTMDKHVSDANGTAAYHLQLDGIADTPNLPFNADIVIDHRTMALIHRGEHDATGHRAVFDVDGRRVHGASTARAGAATTAIDFTLDQPAFLSSFLDAAVNATTLRRGQVYRVPTFGLAANQHAVEWHTVRVVGQDTIRVIDHLATAWVVEDVSPSGTATRTIWLLREPPFFPREIARLPDGSIRRTEQRLLHEHR